MDQETRNAAEAYLHAERGYGNVVHDMIEASRGQGREELEAIRSRMGYWAPEIFAESLFLGTSTTNGLTEVCNTHFQENATIKTLYDEAVALTKGLKI